MYDVKMTVNGKPADKITDEIQRAMQDAIKEEYGTEAALKFLLRNK